MLRYFTFNVLAVCFLFLGGCVSTPEPIIAELQPVFIEKENYPTVEITYDAEINTYPELAQRVTDLTAQIVEGYDYDYYDSALYDEDETDGFIPHYSKTHYALMMQSRTAVAVMGEQSFYIGGLHPLIAFETLVWLPKYKQWLTVQELFGEHPDALQVVRDYVRNDLYQQLEIAKESRANRDWIRDWINKGTANVEDFKLFIPLAAPNGKIKAFNFILPPYQVASWADGTREVEVPAAIIYPHLSRKYQNLLVTP